MNSSKPYLVRALHEWILDNGMTPHIIVNVHASGVEVPPGAQEDGKLVLNIAPRATRALELGNEALSFEARFSGRPYPVLVPMDAVVAIYARESGQGMVFAQEGADPDGPGEDAAESAAGKSAGPNLRVIK